MPPATDHRAAIATALKEFAQMGEAQSPSTSTKLGQAAPVTFPNAARRLFAALGYGSDRRLPITSPDQFCAQLDPHDKLTERERTALGQLQTLELLFQFTDAELAAHGDLFEDTGALQTTKIESYLFFAAELPSGQYTRTALSTLVRAINKPLPMPALRESLKGCAMFLEPWAKPRTGVLGAGVERIGV